MNSTEKRSSEKSNQFDSPKADAQTLIKGLWSVRYQVKDAGRSVDFYTGKLGFHLDHQNLPAFAQIFIKRNHSLHPSGRAYSEKDAAEMRKRQILADFDHPNIARLLDGGCRDQW